jgi:AraC-like DNA-binding protein/mannose-6-phosphate isomerase-like protein (cupin superfamily)
LTALLDPDKVFRKTDMATKRGQSKANPPVATGSTFRGVLQTARDARGETAPREALARHFVLEASGRVKTLVARRAHAVGLTIASGGLESEPHAHREAQVMVLVRGELTCESAGALWIVPPNSALWIPPSVTHRIRARAPLEGYTVFLEPRAAPDLPRDCCTVSVTPLFRELLFRLATRPADYDRKGPDAKLVSVLLHELTTVSVENHRLPMPRDPRIRRLLDAMTADAANGATIKEWAKQVGMGDRTLNRLLLEETGLTFGRWRRQLLIILAIQKMSRGATVQRVAWELGYGSASGFVTMFRKTLGVAPATYMAGRLRAK